MTTQKSRATISENKLRERREYEGLSQAQLAVLAGVSVETISEAENRKRRLSGRVQHRLVHGLNANPAKRQKNHAYRLEDIFPPADTVGATETGRVFADEKARTAWDIAQGVDRLAQSLPPEGQRLDARLVTFEPDQARQGRYALFLAGTVIGTERKGVFLVPERSLRVLSALSIPYRLLTPDEETA